MLACVVRCVDRISTPASMPESRAERTPADDLEAKARSARQGVLSHLAFLRDRYAGVLGDTEED